MPIKDKIIDKTSTFIANKFMGGDKAKKQIAKVSRDLPDLKLANKTRNLDVSDSDYKNPIFRAKAKMSNYETEYAMRRSNANKNK